MIRTFYELAREVLITRNTEVIVIRSESAGLTAACATREGKDLRQQRESNLGQSDGAQRRGGGGVAVTPVTR